MPPPPEVPPQYVHLARTIVQVEAELRRNGIATTLPLDTTACLAQEALRAWFQSGGDALNGLRVRANMIHGLAYAYLPRPNWRRAINVASICLDMMTPEPRTTNPSILRLYALASANGVVLRMLEGSENLRGTTWEHVCIALEYFSNIELDGIGHWKGVVYTAGASLGEQLGRLNQSAVREYAGHALELLAPTAELRHLALQLRGEGDGRVPGSGWRGTNFRARQAGFSVYDLYHFNDQS